MSAVKPLVLYTDTIKQVQSSDLLANAVLPYFAFGHYSNLIIKNDGTTPNTKLSISAGTVVMGAGTTSASAMGETSVSALTLDATTTGNNGLDAGSLAANTWYYIFIVGYIDSNGVHYASLLSTSSTTPTLPGGDTMKRLIGAVRTDASSHFLRFWQYNERVYYPARQSVLSGGAATTLTSVDLSGFVPPTAVEARLEWSATSSGATNVVHHAHISFDNSNNYQDIIETNGTYYWFTDSSFVIPIPTAQTVYYYNDVANMSTSIWVQGFGLNL